MSIEVLLDAESFGVQVTLGPEQSLSELERLVLEAVARGIDTLPEIAALFALPERLVLDLVTQLWSRQHVLVDLVRRRITVAPEVLAALREGRTDELEPARVEVVTWGLVMEPVSGLVIPENQAQSPFTWSMLRSAAGRPHRSRSARSSRASRSRDSRRRQGPRFP